MATQTANSAIANQIHSTDSAIQTYKVSTAGMSPEMLTLVQKTVSETKFNKYGEPYKWLDSEGNFLWKTGFEFAKQIKVSVAKNQAGLPCLNYDAILTDSEKMAIVQDRRNKNTTPATETPSAPAVQTPAIPTDVNNINL
jgi:hypothetical protein